MRTIKLLLLCFSAICIANASAQEILVPEQKIQWLDIQQNRTNYSVVSDLCPSLIISNSSTLPFFAFRASASKGEKHIAPVLANVTSAEISSSYFDNDQLQLITDDFRVEVQSVQSDVKNNQVVTVIPFRKRNGKIERLLSFEVLATTSFSDNQKNNYTYAEHSVLSEGDVYKIAIAKDGVYRIDRSFLEGLGISLSGLDPNTINIYGNGGALIPEKNFVDKADDLVKNAIHIQGESDGVFNSNDFILFYGKGSDTWTLDQDNGIGRRRWFHNKHYYKWNAF